MAKDPKVSKALLESWGVYDKQVNLLEKLGAMNPPPSMLTDVSITPPNLRARKSARDRLVEEIAAFQQKLDGDQEIGFCLASCPNEIVIVIEEVHESGSDMLILKGHDPHGMPMVAVQHVSQMNVLLMAVSKTARKIGFESDG